MKNLDKNSIALKPKVENQAKFLVGKYWNLFKNKL